MSQWMLYALSGVVLFGLGLWGVFTHVQMVRRILATNIIGSGCFLLMVAIARRTPTGPPDPVPQALVLTGIVVAVSATALALAVARRLAESESAASDGRAEETPARPETSGPCP